MSAAAGHEAAGGHRAADVAVRLDTDHMITEEPTMLDAMRPPEINLGAPPFWS